MLKWWLGISFLFVSLWSGRRASFVSVDEDGGYGNVVVAISPSVIEKSSQGPDEIIRNLKDLIKRGNERLQNATFNTFHVNSVSILVPDGTQLTSTDNLIQAATFETYKEADIRIVDSSFDVGSDEPFTFQPSSCGEPGEHVQMSSAFLTDITPLKVHQFLRAWARLRYGVFEEHGQENHLQSSPFYFDGQDNNVKVTGCANPYSWSISDPEACIAAKEGQCSSTFDYSSDVESSVMDISALQAKTFCDERTHNQLAPTVHNILCDKVSTWEVIQRSPDFPTNLIQRNFSNEVNFTIVSRAPMRLVVIIESSIYSEEKDNQNLVFQTFLLAMESMISEHLATGSRIGILFSNRSYDIPMTSLDDDTRKELWTNLTLIYQPDYAKDDLTPDNIREAIETAKAMLKKDSGFETGTIVLMAPGDHLTFNDIRGHFEQNASDMTTLHLIAYPRQLNALSRDEGRPIEPHLHRRFTWHGIDSGPPFDQCDITARLHLDVTLRSIANDSQLDFHDRDLLIYKGIHDEKHFTLTLNVTSNGRIIIRFLTCVDLTSSPTYQDLILFQRVGKGAYFHGLNVKRGPITVKLGYQDNQHPIPLAAVLIWFRSEHYPVTIQQPTLHVSKDNNMIPIIRVAVHVNWVPVLNADVEAIISWPNETRVALKLLDSGNGDPDIRRDDGIYSRYFTELATVQGLYRYTVQVKGRSETRLQTPSPATLSDPDFDGTFLTGFYFGSFYSDATSSDVDKLPPNRILDFAVERVQCMFAVLRWSPPGDDYDNGKVASYAFQCSETIEALDDYSRYSTIEIFLVPANKGETYQKIHWEIPQGNRAYFCAIIAYDDAGNNSSRSNVATVMVPLTTTTTTTVTPTIQFANFTANSSVNPSIGNTTETAKICDNCFSSTNIIVAVVVTFFATVTPLIVCFILTRWRRKGAGGISPTSDAPTSPPSHPVPSRIDDRRKLTAENGNNNNQVTGIVNDSCAEHTEREEYP